MYVCVCKAVTDSRIRQVAARGVCSLRDLKKELGLGSVCGKCVPMAHAVLSKAVQPHKPIVTPSAMPAWGAPSV